MAAVERALGLLLTCGRGQIEAGVRSWGWCAADWPAKWGGAAAAAARVGGWVRGMRLSQAPGCRGWSSP
jgi:hypothetical protein